MVGKNKKVWFLLFLLISLSLACDQSDEANKLVDEANALNQKKNELITKSTELDTELFGDKLKEVNVEEFADYKEENKSKFDELKDLNGQIQKLGLEIIEKFEQASKLQIDDEKYKEYLGFKTQEMKKRQEVAKLDADFVKTFLETEDGSKINQQIEDFNKKAEELKKEATEFESKAEQIIKDNPGSFEKDK